jgi:hypothetical protein
MQSAMAALLVIDPVTVSGLNRRQKGDLQEHFLCGFINQDLKTTTGGTGRFPHQEIFGPPVLENPENYYS